MSYDEIAPKWVAALNELTDVHKTNTAKAGAYSYTYADLATIMRQVWLVMSRNDLGISQTTEDLPNGVGITTTVWHTSGQSITSGMTRVPTGNGDAQAVGSAISYARRYSLLTFTGLATEDDDGASAKAREQHQRETSDPVLDTLAAIKALTEDDQRALSTFAEGRSLSAKALAEDPEWHSTVRDWIAS